MNRTATLKRTIIKIYFYSQLVKKSLTLKGRKNSLNIISEIYPSSGTK